MRRGPGAGRGPTRTAGRAAPASSGGADAAPEHLPIPAWPSGERPRERLLRLGPSALGDAELLAVVLRTGRRGESALALARRLLLLAGEAGLPGLTGCGAEELGTVRGMGQAKVAALVAALEIGRRAVGASPGLPQVNSFHEAVRQLADMVFLDREQFRVLLLNTKRRLLGWEVVAVGGLDEVPVHPREVFKPAIRRSAAAVVLGHNHPSGDPEPSQADVALTRRLVAAGRVLGVAVLDHVVVARRGCVSLRARGLASFDD